MALLCLLLPTAARGESLELARQLYGEGRIPEAIAAFRAAADRLEATDPVTAGAARNNACVLLTNTGRLDDALEECRAALRLREQTGGAEALAKAHNNLGLVLQYLARFEEADRHFRQAREINHRLGDAAGETINWANLGVSATQAGRYSDAIESLPRALALARAHRGEAWAAEQARVVRVNQAVVFERLGAYREALSLYDEVLEESAAMEPRRRAALAVNRGIAYRNLGDPRTALRAFDEARAAFERAGDTAALSNLYLNIGLVHHLNLDDPGAAEPFYRRAMELAVRSRDRAEEIQDRNQLGFALLDLGRLEEAEALFRQGLSEVGEAGPAEGRVASLEGLARVALARGERLGAVELLEAAIEEIERVGGGLDDGALVAGYIGQKRLVYASAVDTLATLESRRPGGGFAERAFAAVHRAKARDLLDALGPAARRSLDSSQQEIAERLQGDPLVEYFVAGADLHRFTLHRGRLTMESLGPAAPIRALVRTVHESLSNGVAPDAAAVAELSGHLLHGLEGVIADAESLRISPDRFLHYLPFEMLQAPGGGLLVEALTVSYLPSGAAIEGLRERVGAAESSLLALGDPVLAAPAADYATPATLWIRRFGLGELPAAGVELQALRRMFPGEVTALTREQATEEAFRERVAGGAGVVHVASHTVVDERHGRGAAILLTPGRSSDGLLDPAEIAGLDYPVDLTVLAACRTALGSAEDGGALSSLTGSFLAAGSSAVVATLWDVDDAATAAFMEQFYYQLRRGYGAAEALRGAKLRMLADPRWSGSEAWSPYVLVGNPAPAWRPARSRWLAPAVAAAALLGLLGFAARRYGARRN